MSMIHLMQAAAYPSYPRNEVHTMSADAADEVALPVVQSAVPPTTLTESEMRTFFDRLSTNFFSLSQQAQQLSDAIGAIADLKVEVSGLKLDNERLKTEVIGLKNRCTFLETEVETAQEMAGQMEQERNELRAKVDLQQTQVESLTSQLTTAKSQAESWKTEAQNYSQKMLTAQEEVRTLTAERDEATRHAKVVDDMNKRQEDTIKAQNESAGQLQTAITLAHHDVDRAQKAKVDADSEVERLKAEIESLIAQRDGSNRKLADISVILHGHFSAEAA